MVDHWVWSRFLSLSYYEHPPMIALLMRFITIIGGNTEMTLEIGSQLTMLFIIFQIYWISSTHFNKNAAKVTLLLLCSTPYFTLGSIFLHITQPFLICWLFALHLYLRLHQSLAKHPDQSISQNKEALRYLLAIGVVAGLGALSKYIMLLFYMGMLAHALLYKKMRHHLLSPWVYVAGLISLLIFTPVLFWNLQNGWVSFKFQFGRGLSGAVFGKNFIEFTVGHLLLFSPFWSWWCFKNTWKIRDSLKQHHSPQAALAVLSLFPLLFFSFMSFKGSISDPHWTNVTYIGLMILAGNSLSKFWGQSSLKKKILAGLLINIAMLALLFTQAFMYPFDTMQYRLEYPEYLRRNGVSEEVITQLKEIDGRIYGTQKFLDRLTEVLSVKDYEQYHEVISMSAMRTLSDPTHPVIGWQETGAQLETLLNEKQIALPQFVISAEYQLSSTITLYLSNHPFPHSLEKKERNIWSPAKDLHRGNSIFICDLPKCPQSIYLYNQYFEVPLELVGSIITKKYGRVVRTLEVYH